MHFMENNEKPLHPLWGRAIEYLKIQPVDGYVMIFNISRFQKKICTVAEARRYGFMCLDDGSVEQKIQKGCNISKALFGAIYNVLNSIDDKIYGEEKLKEKILLEEMDIMIYETAESLKYIIPIHN